MKVTIPTTQDTLENLLKDQNFVLKNVRSQADNIVRILVSNKVSGNDDRLLYVHWCNTEKNGTPIDIKTESAPIAFWETRAIGESYDRFKYILLAADQEIDVFIDVI